MALSGKIEKTGTLSSSAINDWVKRLENRVLTDLAEHAQVEALLAMGGPGPNPPSLPGQAPHRQTDALADGLEVHVEGHTGELISKRNGSSKVPEYLEYGTPKGQMQARPYMGPAYEAARLALPEIVEEAKKHV